MHPRSSSPAARPVLRPTPSLTISRAGARSSGYHRDPEATSEVMEGRWLRSGDLGAVDADGSLHITGRKKDLIITSRPTPTLKVKRPVIYRRYADRFNRLYAR